MSSACLAAELRMRVQRRIWYQCGRARTELPTVRVHRSFFVVAMAEFRGEGRGIPADVSMIGGVGDQQFRGPLVIAGRLRRLWHSLGSQTHGGLPRPDGYVPSTTLWWVEDVDYLGRIAIRHRLTPDLREVGGHIGYDVRPSGAAPRSCHRDAARRAAARAGTEHRVRARDVRCHEPRLPQGDRGQSGGSSRINAATSCASGYRRRNRFHPAAPGRCTAGREWLTGRFTAGCGAWPVRLGRLSPPALSRTPCTASPPRSPQPSGPGRRPSPGTRGPRSVAPCGCVTRGRSPGNALHRRTRRTMSTRASTSASTIGSPVMPIRCSRVPTTTSMKNRTRCSGSPSASCSASR